MCDTDQYLTRDDFGATVWPCVPGHEITGHVAVIGEGVTRFKVGDRVGVGCMINSCRECEPCRAGDEQYCAGPKSCTLTYNGPQGAQRHQQFGGYSTGIVVREEFVLAIPDAIDNATAAPILCAGVTTYHPMKHFGLKPGQTLGVVGIGGLGHMAIQIGKALGATVIAFTTSPEKASEAMSLGADRVVSMDDENALGEPAMGVDLMISTIPYPHDPSLYIALMKPNTTFALVGDLMGLEAFNTAPLVFHRIAISGSLIGGIADMQELLELCAEHGIGSKIKVIELEQIEDAWEHGRPAPERPGGGAAHEGKGQ